MVLPDTNFWLALAFDSHLHHHSARNYMELSAPHSLCFCRITQLGFLRLATNTRAFPLNAVPMSQAWELYGTIFDDERVAFADEPTGIESALRSFTQLPSYSTNVWTDAYLAAFAKTADFELITFDKGFVQYTGLRQTILS